MVKKNKIKLFIKILLIKIKLKLTNLFFVDMLCNDEDFDSFNV